MATSTTTTRMKRSSVFGSGSDVDPAVKAHLEELNKLLSKPILKGPIRVAEERPTRAAEEKKSEKAADAPLEKRLETELDRELEELLQRSLAPRQKPDTWDRTSLAYAFHAPPAGAKATLREYIEENSPLSLLRYAVPHHVESQRSALNENILAVLEEAYPAILDYLVILADRQQQGRPSRRPVDQPIEAVVHFVLNHPTGAKAVVDYALVGAARDLIRREHLSVKDAEEDDSDVVSELRKSGLSFSARSFEKATIARVERFISNAAELTILKDVQAQIGPIPESLWPSLVRLMKESTKPPITKANAPYFIPLLMSQLSEAGVVDESTDTDPEISEKDFDVEYFKDDRALVQVSRSAVKCAAQLYYGMVVGDELNVFDVVNYFTHKFLIRGQVEIQDRRLRDDLQMYVFSGEFLDLDTKKPVDRTRAAERQMFYRQAFNHGGGSVTDDVIVNREFPRLWKVLMLESARYLERAQLSPNPHSFVSKQNVMQAVEDLQYNLSTHCTGMATVISPLIYSELDFVIRRIFMHPEVLKHVVPAGGTWWRVVEALYVGMKSARPKATVLYNKAMLGHKIIRSIADYEPDRFETDTTFSGFITDVDAFITTQSILQESLTEDLKAGEDDEDAAVNGSGDAGREEPDEATAAAGVNGQSEWDF